MNVGVLFAIFSDDTTLLTLFRGSESNWRNVLTDFIPWCGQKNNNYWTLLFQRSPLSVLLFVIHMSYRETVHHRKPKHGNTLKKIELAPHILGFHLLAGFTSSIETIETT